MGIRRMIGVDVTYGDPNTFSATLLYSLPLTLPLWAEKPRGMLRFALIGYVGLSVVCILLTGSRGALVGLGCLSLMLLGVSRRRGVLFMLLALAIPVGWSLLPDELHNRFLTLIDPSVGPANAQQSAEGRTKGILDGLRLWSRSPVTGFGPNSFGKATGRGFQAHNLYGQTLGELGLFGAVALLGMLLAFALNAVEVRRLVRDNTWKDLFPVHLSRAVSLAVLLMLVMGFGSHNLYRYTWMWFGAFQGIALHCLRLRALTSVEMGREEETEWQPAGLGGHPLAGRWDTDLRAV
jgi:O-antigen ligase